jgi:hypothetical protein
MQELEELSGLVSTIYDTASNESLWPDVLKKVAGFVGGPNSALWSRPTSAAFTRRPVLDVKPT